MKSTKRFLLVAAVLVGLALASVGIAYAITNGEPDGAMGIPTSALWCSTWEAYLHGGAAGP